MGFHPARSVVLIGLRRRRIGLTEGLDLPPPEEAVDVAERMIEPLLRDQPDAALIVGYEAGAASPPDRSPSATS